MDGVWECGMPEIQNAEDAEIRGQDAEGAKGTQKSQNEYKQWIGLVARCGDGQA